MDLYIAFVPFEGSGGKFRPVLVFDCDNQTAEIFNITTQYESKTEHIRAGYYPITYWKLAGLYRKSYVDTNAIRNLPLSALSGKTPIGSLTETDKLGLFEFLKNRKESR